ncbi:nuclear transport factor 2 family protein [Cupriavidus basilensis]
MNSPLAFRSQPAPDEAQRKRFITHFDVVGNAGSAKVVLQYPEVTFYGLR